MVLSSLLGLWHRLQGRDQRGYGENSFVFNLLADAEAGRASAIPNLFPLVFDADYQVAEDAARAIARLTENFTLTQWRWLDACMRSYAVYSSGYFLIVKPESLPLLTRLGEQQRLLLGIASFHPNGYVREAAVKGLSSLSDETLPFLVLRLNDWVSKVRQAAYTACIARLNSNGAEYYVEALPFVMGLAETRRQDFRTFIQSVEDLLVRPENRVWTIKGFSSSDTVIRRTCFRLALSSALEDDRVLFRRAFLSNDPIVRRSAARLVRNRPAGDTLQVKFLTQLRHDRLASIRREYLYLCHEKYPELAVGALKAALLDSHPSVRSVARFYLRQHEPSDFSEFYRLALTEPQNLVPALAGLGETGQAEDAQLVAAFMHHPTPAIRRTATAALGRLSGDVYVPQLLNALMDISPKVSSAARDALLPHLLLIEDNVLWEVLAGSTLLHTRRNTLRLMFDMPKWRACVLLLRAYGWLGARQEEILVLDTHKLINRWLARFNSSAVQPTVQQLNQMQEALESRRDYFPEALYAQLQETLFHSKRLIQ